MNSSVRCESRISAAWHPLCFSVWAEISETQKRRTAREGATQRIASAKAHMGQCYNAAKSVPGSQNFRGKMWISRQNLVFIKDSMPLDRQAPDTRLKMVARRVYIYINDIWFSIFLWAKFEAWDLQNAAQNLSVVAQEPPFLFLLNRSGIAGIFLRPKEGLAERLCCHRVSQRGVMADSQHQCSSITCYFITALSDSLHTATLCALRGRLRAMEDLDDIFFEDKLGPGCCT